MRKTPVITPVSGPRAVCNAASVNLNQALTRYDSTALRVEAVSKSRMTLRRVAATDDKLHHVSKTVTCLIIHHLNQLKTDIYSFWHIVYSDKSSI